MSITSTKLTEKHYIIWCRAIRLALAAKQRLSYIDGKSVEPALTDENYDQWNQVNSMVCSWIINSISESLKEQFMFIDNVRSLWDEIALRFGSFNGPMLYDIKREISLLSQGSLSVVGYFSKLKRLWDERNALRPLPVCKCGSYDGILEIDEEERLMQFLFGLNINFEGAKDQILMMDLMPSVNKAYALVLAVEKKLSLNNQQIEQSSNSSAMFAKSYQADGNNPLKYHDTNRLRVSGPKFTSG